MSEFLITRERIMSGKVHPNLVTCAVETLRAVTLERIDEDLIESLKRRPDSKRLFRKAGWRLYLDDGISIWFNQYKDNGTVVFELNMSDFGTYWKAVKVLEEELGPWALDAKVVRCDLNVTVPVPFRKFFNGLDFGRKWSSDRQGTKRTGETFYFSAKGRKHALRVYDKRKESRSKKNKGKPPIEHPCTRIEMDSKPKKGMRVRELPLVQNHQPFKFVTRYDVILIRPVPRDGESQKSFDHRTDRFWTFKTKYEELGWHETRRRLSQDTNRNFLATYQPYFRLEKLEPSLDEIFQIGIRGFFAH